MHRKMKPSGKRLSMSAGLAVGNLVAICIILFGAVLLAKLVDKELLSENKIGYGIIIILVASSYFAAIVSYNQIRHHKLIVCIASGIIQFFVLLSSTALFFDGEFSAVLETAGLILCGSVLGALTGLGQKRGGKQRKIKFGHC